MKKNIILSTNKQNRVFTKSLACDEYENLTILSIKNRYSALKKLNKYIKNENVIISNSDIGQRIFNNRVKLYNNVTLDVIIPLINKICRSAAEKFSYQVPFGEIIIFAKPTVAIKIISSIHQLARLFTIVSKEKAEKNEIDEIYFKYGTIIRVVNVFDKQCDKETLIIYYDTSSVLPQTSYPIINISNNEIISDTVINVHNISIRDACISRQERIWGGECGVAFYELLGERPGPDAAVDLNRLCDKIFLLDMGQI